LRGCVYARSRVVARCRSSVVEHSIGNGEVDSSILSGSTIFSKQYQHLENTLLPIPPSFVSERKSNTTPIVGENAGNTFSGCSAKENPAPMGVGNGAEASINVEHAYTNETLHVRQARRVAMVYGLAFETAATIAALAYAVAS
jgi:hypothetical protein